MFTLIAMGTGVAWLYSVVATLAPGIFPAAFRADDGSVAVYFEAAAVITVLVLLGQVLELRPASRPAARSRRCSTSRPRRRGASRRRHRGRGPARHRHRRRPAARAARREGAGRWRGLEGRAPSTSRWSPASRCRSPRQAGDPKVIGGTMNQTGALVMRAEKVGRDTMLSQIVQMVAEAQRSAARRSSAGRSGLGWFVPAVIASRCSPSSPGRSGVRSRAWPTPSSRPSPC
jgi:Cu+-exporting ATPase